MLLLVMKRFIALERTLYYSMVRTSDVILSGIGVLISVYGGATKDPFPLGIGLTTIFLAITLNLQEHEEDIKILKAQINTQNELKRIREELKEVKDAIKK